MLAPEFKSTIWALLVVTLPLITVAAVVAWSSYARLKLRSPGILFLVGLLVAIAAVIVLADPGHSISDAYEPIFQRRLAIAFVLAAAGISNVAISLYLAHCSAKALRSAQEPDPSPRSGLRRLRSQR